MLPGFESHIRDLVKWVNFHHPIKGRIESMGEAGGEYHITITYRREPYTSTAQYEAFEREMRAELEREVPHLVGMPLKLVIFLRTEGDGNEIDEVI